MAALGIALIVIGVALVWRASIHRYAPHGISARIMTALGQSLPIRAFRATSGLLPLATGERTSRIGNFVPLGDITCPYNHPSGDPTLSKAEIRMTKAIIDIASPCTITSSSARTGMPA